MQTALKPRLTAREYLLQERKAEVRSEFLDGEVFAMSGGTWRHSRIEARLITALENRLAGKSCEVFTSDMRLKVEATELYAYPDVQVACGDLRFEDEHGDVLLNPKIIAEVLSESTAAWDRGEKFRHYRYLESLAEYLLVSQEAWQIEHYVRQPDGSWRFETIEGEAGVLSLPSIKCKIPLTEIYSKTGLAPNPEPTRTKPERKPKKL